jgi:hypothetical protein
MAPTIFHENPHFLLSKLAQREDPISEAEINVINSIWQWYARIPPWANLGFWYQKTCKVEVQAVIDAMNHFKLYVPSATLRLSDICLDGYNLIAHNLSGAQLLGSTFPGASCANVNFSGCRAIASTFQAAFLSGGDFSGADLSYCDFKNANVSDVKFDGANVDGLVKSQMHDKYLKTKHLLLDLSL